MNTEKPVHGLLSVSGRGDCGLKRMDDTPEDPLDPSTYELKLLYGRRPGPEVELGWQLRETPHGLLVERVTEGSPMGEATVTVGDCVMSVNGHRIKTKADLDREIDGMPTSFRMMVARKRLKRLDMVTVTLLGLPEHRTGWDHVVCRFDRGNFLQMGLKMGMLAGCLSVLSVERQGAANAAGLKAGDRVLLIGSARPRDESHYRRILAVIQTDPVDIVVERRRRNPTAPSESPGECPSPSADSSAALDEGNPSTGVPDVPLELELSLDTKRPEITKHITIVKATAKGRTGRGQLKDDTSDKSEKRVKIKKPEPKSRK